jgi:hypothetical protein
VVRKKEKDESLENIVDKERAAAGKSGQKSAIHVQGSRRVKRWQSVEMMHVRTQTGIDCRHWLVIRSVAPRAWTLANSCDCRCGGATSESNHF